MKRLMVLSAALAVPSGAEALGIRLFDHDAFATARGDAFVATADNASAVYYNPAGITQLRGQNVRGTVYTVDVESRFDPIASGPSLDTENSFMPLPGIFYTWSPGGEDFPFSFGAGYYLPYGLEMEWPENSQFRTVTTFGSLEYHTISAVAAWRVLPTLSIAAGPTLNYAHADLRRGVFSKGDEFKFDGEDTDFGAVAGILWQPTPRHSFGISYRSPTTMNLEGHSSVTPGLVPRQSAETELPLPQVVIVGYSFRPTTNWNFEIDVDWTDFDSVNTPVLKQPSGNVALPLQWESSWAFEVGGTRYLENGLRVSAGYVFIENSAPTRTFDPLIPDQDLHVFSAGVGGDWRRFNWDLTYQFTYGPGRHVAGSVYGPSVSGDYTFTAHGISVSLGYRF
jgi:long-chain fatty acid transport protein